MRNYLILFLLLLSFSSLHSQVYWEKIFENDYDLSNWVTAMDCYDEMNCVAASVMSRIVFVNQTKDGGRTWETKFIDSTHLFLQTDDYFIRSIHFVNEATIFALGNKGYFYQSPDFGNTWELGRFDVHLNQNLQKFKDNFGLIAAYTQSITSNDYANNWKVKDFSDFPPDDLFTRLWNCAIVNQDTFFFSGANIQDFRLTYTYDGGKTYQYSKPVNFRISDLHFFDGRNGIAVGSSNPHPANLYRSPQSIYLTTDAGETWETVLDTILPERGLNLRKIILDRKGRIWTTDTQSNIWLSEDKGKNWRKADIRFQLQSSSPSYGYALLSDSVMLISRGRNSQIYKANLSQFTSVERTEDNDIGEVPDFVNIFPNPVGEELTLRSLKPLFSVEVVDMFGRSVLTMPDTFKYGFEPELNLDCSNLAIGMYILKLQTESGFEYRKFVVNR